MIMDLGYTYHCRVFVKSFLGPLDIPGEFEHVDRYHFKGKLRVLGKWRPMKDCIVTEDEEYQYGFDVIGYRIRIYAHLTDEGEILAYATARGKKNMPVEGGFLKRVSHADGHEEPFNWPGIERFR